MKSMIERGEPSQLPTERTGPNVAAKGAWTIQEAAEYLSLPVSSLYKMTGPKARLRVPHVRIAGRLRFRRADLDRWLDVLTVSNLDVLAKVRRGIAQR